MLPDLPETRLALFREGSPALSSLREIEPVRVHGARDDTHLGVAVHHLVEACLQDLEAAGREAQHLLAPAVDRGLEVVSGHDLIHKAHFQRLIGLVASAQHPHLASLLRAHDVCEVGHEEAVGRARDLRSRLTEDCVVGGDGEVAAVGHVVVAAEAVALHLRDHRLA